MTSAIAPKATLALNICDFTRYAKSPRTVLWTNIFALSIPVTLCAILGVVVTSAVQVMYGVLTWNPLQVCELWSSRAAQFFAAFCWALAVIATNISAKYVHLYFGVIHILIVFSAQRLSAMISQFYSQNTSTFVEVNTYAQCSVSLPVRGLCRTLPNPSPPSSVAIRFSWALLPVFF